MLQSGQSKTSTTPAPQSAGKSVAVVKIFDCNAHSSAGEICCKAPLAGLGVDFNVKGNGGCAFDARAPCTEGLREYKEEYIAPLVEVLRRYHNEVPVVVIVEPDSLGNVITNVIADPMAAGSSRCSAATAAAYREGISFAVGQIAEAAPSVGIYVDAGSACAGPRIPGTG